MEGGVGEYSFMRQLSTGSSSSHYRRYHSSLTKGSISKRWGSKQQQQQRNEEDKLGFDGGLSAKKRVMVLVDQSARAKHAMMWALTHVARRGDILTLLHVVPPHHRHNGQLPIKDLVKSLGSLCKARRPEVEVEALVIQGPKLATVLSQVKKLEASVLVLRQSNPSLFSCLFRSSGKEFVEQCINKAECLTMAVRKRSKGLGGYLVSTRWHKNFWLLA